MTFQATNINKLLEKENKPCLWTLYAAPYNSPVVLLSVVLLSFI